jgi:hypothetical protein
MNLEAREASSRIERVRALSAENGSRTVTPISVDSIREPLFDDEKRVLVVDVDGVLVNQVQTFYNGVRGSDGYKVQPQAREFLANASKKFDEVVLWSRISYYLNGFDGKLFSEVPYHISGASLGRKGIGYKDLRLINRNTRNVVGIEDNRWFYPRCRTIQVQRDRVDLRIALLQAVDMI